MCHLHSRYSCPQQWHSVLYLLHQKQLGCINNLRSSITWSRITFSHSATGFLNDGDKSPLSSPMSYSLRSFSGLRRFHEVTASTSSPSSLLSKCDVYINFSALSSASDDVAGKILVVNSFSHEYTVFVSTILAVEVCRSVASSLLPASDVVHGLLAAQE